MTRDELIADIERMGLPAEVEAATIALTEFQNGLPVDQTCLRCGKLFEVFGLPRERPDPSAWAIVCGCGQSMVRGR